MHEGASLFGYSLVQGERNEPSPFGEPLAEVVEPGFDTSCGEDGDEGSADTSLGWLILAGAVLVAAILYSRAPETHASLAELPDPRVYSQSRLPFVAGALR